MRNLQERRKQWIKERLALNEPPSPLLPETREALGSVSQQELAELREDDVAFKASPAGRRVLAALKHQTRVASQPRTRATWALATVAAVVCGVVILAIPRGNPAPGAVEDAEVTRVKGLAPKLVLSRLEGAAPQPLKTAAQVRPGDVITISYVAAGRPYGAIYSVDSRGEVTLHSPASEDAPPTLEPEGQHTLSLGYRLDATAGTERFYLVASPKPFSVHALLDAVRAGRSLPMPTPSATASLNKVTP